MSLEKRNLFLGVAHEALWGVSFAMVDPFTVLQLALKDLGGDPSLAGLLGGLLYAGLALLQLPAAFLLPGRFTTPAWTAWLHLPALAFTLGLALLFAVPGLEPGSLRLGYLALATGFFVCLGLAVPFWIGMIARCVRPGLRGRYLGWCFALAGLGGVLGGALAVRWIRDGGTAWGYALTFGTAFVVQALSLGLLALLKPLQGPPAPPPGLGSFLRRQWSAFTTHPVLVRFLALILLMNAAIAPLHLFTGHFKDRGLPTGWWTALNAAKSLGGVLGAFVLGYLLDRRGPRLGLGLAFSAMAGALLMASLPGPWGALGAFFGGGYLVPAFPVLSLYMVTLIGAKDHSTALAGALATLSAPMLLALPWLNGLAAQRLGHAASFTVAGLCCALGCALCWRWRSLDTRRHA